MLGCALTIVIDPLICGSEGLQGKSASVRNKRPYFCYAQYLLKSDGNFGFNEVSIEDTEVISELKKKVFYSET